MSETNPPFRVFRWVVGPALKRAGDQLEDDLRAAAPDAPDWAGPVAVMASMVAAVVGTLAVELRTPDPAGRERERCPDPSANDEDADDLEDALATLGVETPPQPTQADAKAAYRSLVVETHPDQGGDAETFEKVHEAWETVESSVELSGGSDDVEVTKQS